jgi:uncharacterized protein (DUF1697 family)
MKKITLLRGVTPVGKNKIPKMAYLREILTEAGLSYVQTYIQSGNVICETDLPDDKLSQLIHQTIRQRKSSCNKEPVSIFQLEREKRIGRPSQSLQIGSV